MPSIPSGGLFVERLLDGRALLVATGGADLPLGDLASDLCRMALPRAVEDLLELPVLLGALPVAIFVLGLLAGQRRGGLRPQLLGRELPRSAPVLTCLAKGLVQPDCAEAPLALLARQTKIAVFLRTGCLGPVLVEEAPQDAGASRERSKGRMQLTVGKVARAKARFIVADGHEALELDYLPSHLIVLGGGYVGLELAQSYRRFGSRATIIQSGSQLLNREDPDIADEMQRILSDEGIQILLAAETLNVRGRSGKEVGLTVRTISSEQKIEGSDILVAAGRIPNTAFASSNHRVSCLLCKGTRRLRACRKLVYQNPLIRQSAQIS
jgi:hypothetical protein